MPLTADHFAIIDLPPMSPEALESYEHLPVDAYMGNGTRYKKFSQYRMHWEPDTGWGLELLPHRDYTTFTKYNAVAGGIRRVYKPIEADFSELLKAGAEGFQLGTSEDWQLNVHQNRTRATADKPGPLTPEGVHHDGHEFVMIAVLRRHNVAGAQTRLWLSGASQPFWVGTLQAGQGVLIDDRAIAHDVTDLLSADGNPAHRDIVIAAFSRWSEKWYGDEHDKAALAGSNGDGPGRPVADLDNLK